MEFAAAPPRREQIAEAHDSRLLAQTKTFVEETRFLGRLVKGLYRKVVRDVPAFEAVPWVPRILGGSI